MIKSSRRRGAIVLAAILALGGTAEGGPIATADEVAIHDAWARASLGRTRTSAVYMTIEVTGDRVDRLIAAASPDAETAELHTHLMGGGVARMRPVDAIEIAPGAPTVLEPGGLHIMLTGLRRDLVEGETLPLSLTFESAGTIQLEVPIEGMVQSMGRGHHGGHQPGTN